MRLQTKDITMCGMFAAFIAVGAFLKIDIPYPFYTMHFTLQWFFVLMAGLLLETRISTMTVMVYLCIGLMGIPIFAAGGGPGYVLRPGFGFLLGFLPAVGAIAQILKIMKSRGFIQMLFASVVGMCIYYGIGAVYFYFICNAYAGNAVSWSVILTQYCLVTVVPDLVLCILASSLCTRLFPVICQAQ